MFEWLTVFINIPTSYFLQVLGWIGLFTSPVKKPDNMHLKPNSHKKVEVKYEDVKENIRIYKTNNKLYLHKNNHPDTYFNQSEEEKKETKKTQFLKHCQSVEVVYSVKVNQLILDYIDFKKSYGTKEEKNYFKTLSNDSNGIREYIFRLITKRNQMYMFDADTKRWHIKDRAGKYSPLKVNDFNTFSQPFNEYISQEEQLISAFLSIGSDTFFINDGRRENKAQMELDQCIESGYQAGTVGASFERAEALEYKHMLITSSQNTTAKGYGQKSRSILSYVFAKLYHVFGKTPLYETNRRLNSIFEKFYELDRPFYSFDEAKALVNATTEKDLVLLNPWETDEKKWIIFSRDIYKKRMKHVIVPFLENANVLDGLNNGKKAVIYAVGLGLGNWTRLPEDVTSKKYAAIPKDSKVGKLIDTYFDYESQSKPINTLTALCTYLQIQIYKKWVEKTKPLNISHIIFGWFGEHSNKGIPLKPAIFSEFSTSELFARSVIEEKILSDRDAEDKFVSEQVPNTFKVNQWAGIDILWTKLGHSSNKLFTTEQEKKMIRRTQYAGDGAAFPGNESWFEKGMFNNSGEPAAIVSGLNGVIQNSMINPALNNANGIKMVAIASTKNKLKTV